MNYKFLNGARKAGVTLALILLGVSGVLAQTTVTVNLGDIKGNGTSRLATGTGATQIVSGGTDENVNVTDVFAKWTATGTTKEVTASFDWKRAEAASGSTPAIAKGYRDTLYFKGTNLTASDTVKIVGKAGSTVKVSLIVFDFANGSVNWDGGEVEGVNTAGARRNPEFLRITGTVTRSHRIAILSGSITSSAESILRGIKTASGEDLTKTDGTQVPEGNFVGAVGSAAAGSRNIKLVSKGKGAALVGDGSFTINPPGSGQYTITADSVAVKSNGDGDSVQIGSELAGVGGVLTINAWTTVSSATLAALGSSAIEASKIKVVGMGNSGSSKNIVINSKSKSVLAANGSIYVEEAEIAHAAPTGTVGATVFSSANGNVELKKVNVTNGASGNVAGRIVEAGGTITVKGGKFAPAGDSKGVALSSDATVTIEGAKITSAGTATAAGGYVVAGRSVTVQSSSSDSAVVAWAGTGAAVGGIYASENVDVSTNNLYKVEVRVAGAGVGVDVWPDAVDPRSGSITISGSPGTSAIVSVGSGQAIVLSNSARGANPYWDVRLNNAIVRRSGTASTTALVDVTGGDAEIDGLSLAKTNLSAGSNVAVVVKKNSDGDGGFLEVKGGTITGVTGGVTAETIVISRGVNGLEGDQNIKIETTSGVAVKAVGLPAAGDYTVGHVIINNGNAVILNTNGVASTSDVPSAAVFSLHKGITVFNVDSIRAGGQAVALLTLKPDDINSGNVVPNGRVSVYSGKIKSAGSYAINAAAEVLVDLVAAKKGSAAKADTLIDSTTRGVRDTVTIGAKRGDVLVSTAATSPTFSAIYSDGGKVNIGRAEVSATAGGGASAVYTLRGEVTVFHEDALVSSASGTGIYVRNEKVNVNGGTVISNPASGAYAAIWVVDGNVTVGKEQPKGWSKDPVKQWTRVTSNGSLAIYADGAGKYTVEVGKYGILNVKGAAATAGGIRVLKNIDVTFNGQFTASGDKSKAFAIEAAVGDVFIGGVNNSADTLATIKSDEGVAVTTVGGNINVSSYTSITGNSGKLLYAKDTTNRKAGIVTIGYLGQAGSGDNGSEYINVYNKNGSAIKAVEKVYIYGKTGDALADAAVAASRVVVGTDTDTAITTGKVTTTETISGEVYVKGGRVWAAGNYNNSSPIAIASKKVYLEGGVVEANTEKTAVDNEEVYTTANATGISIRDKAGAGELKITGGKIIAHGKSVGIKNNDTSVTVLIEPPAVAASRKWSIGNGHVSDKGRAAISIAAGNNGTAIWSKGAITVLGHDTITPEDKSADGKLSVNVYIGSGNKPNARVIQMPVEDGTKRKDLWLERAFVEAGSDGAIAIEGGKNTLTRVDHSVVLVRHASTAVKGLGGVFVYSGYVEVLATEDDKSGTAITGNEIRIDGGRSDDQDKSEVHSKGIAVYDLRSAAEGKTVVQITSVVHLSGNIKTDLDVGSSVLGDTAYLTMGSVNSSRLYELSTLNVNETVRDTYDTLFIPKGITVNVADNGSRFETEENDIVIDSGVISTVGKQAGAKFINNGKVVVVKDGNVSFNKADNESFYNASTGVLVLKTGSKLDNKVLVHDSGAYISTLNATDTVYTFLRWARVLGDGARGTGQVIVPPLFASLYDNTNNRFTENTDWDVFSSRTDSVYTVVEAIKYPIDERYKPYIDGVDDLPLSGTNVEWVDEDGETAYLTAAGTFTRTAKAKNEAGEAEKTFTHKVAKVPLLKIEEWQDPTSSEYFFDGYVLSEAGDTILIREAGYEPLYSGKADNHVVNVKGALSSVTVWPDDKEVYYGGTNGWGLGVPTIWYESTNESSSYYQLSSRVPVNVGTYNVYASFAEGRDFVAVPTNDAVFIGTFEIREGTVASVFGTKTTESTKVVSLLAGKDTTVRVPLPKVSIYEAKYFGDNADLEADLDGDIEGYVAGSARLAGGDTLVFGVNRLSEIGQSMTFQVGIDPSYARNFQDDQYITVRVNFLSEANMVEAKPDYVSVDYKNDLLIGFNRGSVYSINGVVTTFTTTSSYPIDKEWEGDTVKIVALPSADSYKTKSDTARIVVAARLGVTAALDSVKVDAASTASAADGRLTGTTVAMEYKLASDSVWKQAGNVVTGGLKAGEYIVRIAATEYSFASEPITRTIGTLVSIADANREIPTVGGTTEVAVAPVKIKASAFTAGPSPVSKNGTIKFFSTKQVKTGTLYIFDATGKSVGKVRAKSGTGEIGSWNVGNKAEGLYVIKGALVGKDGTKEKVSFVFSVVK